MPAQLSSPPNLKSLQTWLRWVFTEPRGVVEALRDTPPPTPSHKGRGQSEPLPRLSSWLVTDPELPLENRLAIYSNAYFIRLLETLGSVFPVLKKTLGDEPFRLLIADYLMKFPSKSPNIEEVGRELPSYLTSHLSDLAKLEWIVLHSLYTDRFASFDSTQLAKISAEDWPKVKFIFDPTVSLFKAHSAVRKIWEDVTSEGESNILVYRDDNWVQVRFLDAFEFLALTLFKNGSTLDSVCEELGRNMGSQLQEEQVQTWFTKWIQTGVVKEIKF